MNWPLAKEKIEHKEDNLMFGIRIGKHKGRRYVRFDFWSVSYRWTKRNPGSDIGAIA